MCVMRSNLKRELGFTLRLSPDDKCDNDTHAEQDTENDNIPHCTSTLDGQQTKAEDQQTWKRCGLETSRKQLNKVLKHLKNGICLKVDFIPSRLVQTLTVKPERLEGSVMSGKSIVLKLKRSSMPGRIPMLGVLMVMHISMSSCVLAV